MQNGCIERFNRRYREEVLDCYVFETLSEVRQMTEDWRQRYNEVRTQCQSTRGFQIRSLLGGGISVMCLPLVPLPILSGVEYSLSLR